VSDDSIIASLPGTLLESLPSAQGSALRRFFLSLYDAATQASRLQLQQCSADFVTCALILPIDCCSELPYHRRWTPPVSTAHVSFSLFLLLRASLLLSPIGTLVRSASLCGAFLALHSCSCFDGTFSLFSSP
jgi:hypothetical protein